MHDPPLITPPPLAPTLEPLGGEPRRTLDRLHEMGFRHVQLSATQPGLRPRELDRSARRDLLAIMRRRELAPAGLDVWIPPEHFADPTHIDRAINATEAAIEMASDLGRIPISMTLPAQDAASDEAMTAIMATAHRHGVPIADHAVFTTDSDQRPRDEFIGIGIDPVAWLSAGHDPAKVVAANTAHILTARLCDISSTGMRCPPGEPGGRLDIMTYQVALHIAGYSQPVILDTRQWLDPWQGLKHSRS